MCWPCSQGKGKKECIQNVGEEISWKMAFFEGGRRWEDNMDLGVTVDGTGPLSTLAGLGVADFKAQGSTTRVWVR